MTDIIKNMLLLFDNRFIAMTGAKIVYDDTKSSLYIKFKGSKVSNFLECSYNKAKDLYDMKFKKIRGLEVKDVNSFEDVYVSEVKTLFTQVTGLYTNL